MCAYTHIQVNHKKEKDNAISIGKSIQAATTTS